RGIDRADAGSRHQLGCRRRHRARRLRARHGARGGSLRCSVRIRSLRVLSAGAGVLPAAGLLSAAAQLLGSVLPALLRLLEPAILPNDDGRPWAARFVAAFVSNFTGLWP